MGSHLLGSSIGGHQDLEVVFAALGEGSNLLIQSLDLIKVAGLGETLSAGALGGSQPGRELLDSSSVLSPVLDILRVFVTLGLGPGLEISHVLGDSVQLVLEVLGILGDL